MLNWLDLGDNALSIILVGDINLRNVTDPNVPFALVQGIFDEANLKFGNCEGCFSDPTKEIPFKKGWFHPDRSTVEALARAGFDAVGCANNVHYGADAILESLDHLDRYQIAYTGAGKNRTSARQPIELEKNGVRFGFLSYTSVFWPIDQAAGPNQPGVSTIKGHTAYQPHPRIPEMPGGPAIVVSWPDEDELREMQKDVETLRKRVDVLVLSCHWGISGDQNLADYQTTIGHAAIDAGADLVIGHHPHVPQGVEVYNDRVIFYSLGNFIFGWEKMATQQRNGLLVHCSVQEKTLTKVSFVPVWRNKRGQPKISSLKSAEGMEIIQAVEKLSGVLHTKFSLKNEEVIVWRK